MSIIRIDRDGLMTINQIWRLVLRLIYDEKHAGESDLYLVENSIQIWSDIVKQHNVRLQDAWGDEAFKESVGRRGSTIDEIEYQLVLISAFLVKQEEGFLEDNPFYGALSKRAYREHKIDYRKSFPNIFPECRPTRRALEAAQEVKRKNDLDNKEYLN